METISKSILTDAQATADELSLITARSPSYQAKMRESDAAFKDGDVDTYITTLTDLLDMEAELLKTI
jgi:hypothetical protein